MRNLVFILAIGASFWISFLAAGAAVHNGAGPLLEKYCFDCHGMDVQKGDLNLERTAREAITSNPKTWENAIRKLQRRQMPPANKKRPAEGEYEQLISLLEKPLDEAARKRPDPGRTDTFRRLTRTEYQNAIRDLLAVQIDASALLPKDESSLGFDNVTVGGLSPALLDRHILAAQKISQLAIGASPLSEDLETIRLKPDLTQEEHVEGLPLGTRGGALLERTFPKDAEYEFRIRLTRDRNEEVEGLHEPHEMLLLIDSEVAQKFAVAPPTGRINFAQVDQHLHARIHVQAGPHRIGITFLKYPSSLIETRRQPYAAHFNMHRHPRQSPAIYQVSIQGPYNATGPGDTPSRRRVLIAQPSGPEDFDACAKKVLSPLARFAFRRPATEADLAKPMEFFRNASKDGFEAGIENALAAILVSPEFLFRIESDPEEAKPGEARPISGLELASRLSFFLWSSIPDEELLDAAEQGKLSDPGEVEQQVNRMLADPKAEALVTNFADQWLYLRNLDSFSPDLRLFPDFDDNLRQALRKETELLVKEVFSKDRSVMELINPGSAYLNERLAAHYQVPHIYGSRFRKVQNAGEFHRGGLLRQGSILAVTSYPTRTSPVLRGNWLLKNILGAPTPPPPANVPALKDNTVAANLSVRERLSEHRAHAACAVCHDIIDPAGFSLENFDAAGRWRLAEEGKRVDASGGLPDGAEFEGVSGLEAAIARRPELFAQTLTEKLLTFALGRGVDYQDGPAIRAIVEEAKKNDYRFSSIILGIAKSPPFTMRKTL
jgi:hypothetical protein